MTCHVNLDCVQMDVNVVCGYVVIFVCTLPIIVKDRN